jgi:hypothetical protein
VRKCLEDPKRNICHYRSTDSRLATTEFEIQIKHLRPESMTRTIWIRLTGPRPDERTRSASPVRRAVEGSERRHDLPSTHRTRRLPVSVPIYAMPSWNWEGNRILWSGRVKEPKMTDQAWYNRARNATGREPVYLGKVDMGKRVSEQEVCVQWSVQLISNIDHPKSLQLPRQCYGHIPAYLFPARLARNCRWTTRS